MQKVKIFIIIGLFGLLIHSNGQNKPKNNELNQQKEYFDDAEFFYGSEEYREALYNFLKLYEQMPDNCNINYRIGMCYINIPGEEQKSIPYFEQAITNMSEKYEKSELSETQAPLHALFYLGNAYRINNELDKALSAYKKFINNPFFERNYNSQMVDKEVEACERAKLISDNPIKIKLVNLGNIINNANANQKAVTNADGKVLVYLSSLKFYDAIMLSRKTDTGWIEPDNISPQIGSDGDCEPTWMSADGKTLLLVKKAKGNNDIYITHLDEKNNWSLMEPLNKNINSKWNESSACISSDGQTIYFSSDRKGGEGKLDIYKSVLDAQGGWGEAVNLGKTINTEYNETNPFICQDGKTLYFSSEGHLNMGGYDIFLSILKANGKWETTINVGFPLNSTSNDMFYQPLGNGETAFVTLTRPGGYGKEDIYQVENISVAERNNPNQTEKTKQKKIMVRDKSTNEVIGILYVDIKDTSVKVENQTNNLEFKVQE
jgi:hypothetical protein